MHDSAVPIMHRMDAAKALMALGLGNVSGIGTLHVKIEGGIPEYDSSAEPRADINNCISRTTPCPWAAIVRSIQGVNDSEGYDVTMTPNETHCISALGAHDQGAAMEGTEKHSHCGFCLE
jgi:hypothetical protein